MIGSRQIVDLINNEIKTINSKETVLVLKNIVEQIVTLEETEMSVMYKDFLASEKRENEEKSKRISELAKDVFKS